MNLPSHAELLALHNDYLSLRNGQASAPDEISIPDGESGIDLLNKLTGLDDIKATIYAQLSYRKIMDIRKKNGFGAPVRLPHMLLVGPPGTGKTTVARLIADIYAKAGILKKDSFIETSRAELVGKYIGDTEFNTREKIRQASGGCLFIDEIYSLVEAGRTQSNDFGLRVIDALMPILSDPKSDIMVIGAGYTENIEDFISSNPGLCSRFPTILKFVDYSPVQLQEISLNYLRQYGFEFDADVEDAILKLIMRICQSIKNHGNARMAITLANKTIEALCQRCVRQNVITKTSVNLIKSEDIPQLTDLFPISTGRKAVGF